MRSLWAVGVFLAIAALIGCQSSVDGQIVMYDTNNLDRNANELPLSITQPLDESVVRSNPIVVSGNTESGADVMINGLSTALENGHFSALVELEQGPNIIDISAADNSGKQASRYLTVVYVP